MNAFVDSGPPVTIEDLEVVETTFGFHFPIEFREYYIKQNGGRPTNKLLKRDETIYVVSEFFPIKFGKTNCLFEDVVRDLKVDQHFFPENLVPFAGDPGGDFYCFSIAESDKGSIWIYRGEYFDNPKRAVRLLAHSLNEFIEELTAEADVK